MKTLSAAAVSKTKLISSFYKKNWLLVPPSCPPSKHSLGYNITHQLDITHQLGLWMPYTSLLLTQTIDYSHKHSFFQRHFKLSSRAFKRDFCPEPTPRAVFPGGGHVPRWQASHQSTAASFFFWMFNTGQCLPLSAIVLVTKFSTPGNVYLNQQMSW